MCRSAVGCPFCPPKVESSNPCFAFRRKGLAGYGDAHPDRCTALKAILLEGRRDYDTMRAVGAARS